MTMLGIAFAVCHAFSQITGSNYEAATKHSGLQVVHSDGAVTLRLNDEGRVKKEEIAISKAAAADYKRIRPVVQHGVLHHLVSPCGRPFAALMYTGGESVFAVQEETEDMAREDVRPPAAVVFVLRLKDFGKEEKPLKLRGLDAASMYCVRQINSDGRSHAGAPPVLSGGELMEKGFDVRLSGDCDSAVFEIVKAMGGVRLSVPFGEAKVGFSLEVARLANDVPLTVGNCDMRSLSVVTNVNDIVATWKGHATCGDDFTVSAKLRMIPDGGFEYAAFSYSGNESAHYVRKIAFPEVTLPRTENTAIFHPETVGEIYRPQWRRFGAGSEVTSNGPNWLTFSCIAALNDDGISYFLDQRGNARFHTASLVVAQGAALDTLVLRNVYTPPVTDALRKEGVLPYPGVCTPYRGGWYEAAKMHRAWFETTPWFKKAASRDFSKLREIALWMWSRGGIGVTEPPVHWFMKETGLKVGLDWYWWHGIPYDTSFPYFWPPRDGVENFRASVGRMRKAGAFVQTYTNGASWDCDDPRWAEGGQESVIVQADGENFSKMYNVFTRRRLARMCGEAPKFQKIIRTLERNLRESGLDGVYMDQITCGAHSPCYNPLHSHAPGGDAVEMPIRSYVQSVRDENPGFILSSEATSETYFDLFEASIMLYSSWERFGKGSLPEHEPVPAVSVIYRGANVLFGSFATPGGAPAWDPLWGERPDREEDVEVIVSKYTDQFAVEFARGIIWGIQPLVHNFTMKDVKNPRLVGELQFMKDSAKFYYGNRDFLFDGELLKPATLKCAAKRVEFLATSCYKRVKDSATYVQEALPCVFHSEWRAKDGRKAAVLANWTRETQTYELHFEGVKKTGTLAPLSWRLETL